jgi:hypothetical protein
MKKDQVVQSVEDISSEWLTNVLKRTVVRFEADTFPSNWSSQIPIQVELADGTKLRLRLKLCLGSTFGRSEVDYYTRDYAHLQDAPLVHCWDAQFEPTVGYHVLLDDLAPTHTDRRDAAPSLEYGLAVAEALGRTHRHHWGSQPVPQKATLDRYFAEIRLGIDPMERATGLSIAERFAVHEKALRSRFVDQQGMSLLHGDLNPTNILTPKGAKTPVYFLDRQPFDWSLTYSLAVYDLAYFLVLWWPSDIRAAHEAAIFRHWFDTIDQDNYGWEQAQADWKISVEQCLHVPLEWCSKPDTAERMRWLWEMQLARVAKALGDPMR